MHPSGQKTVQTPHFTQPSRFHTGRLDRQSPVRLYRDEPGSSTEVPMASSLQFGVGDCLDNWTS